MTLSFLGRFFSYLKLNWILVILIVLSIYDLRIDIRILLDFFTFSTLSYTISEHPLAITVLILCPSLLKSMKEINN